MLIIAYQGTNYCGWQKQKNAITIEETINKLVNNKAINEDLYIQAFCNDQINFSNIGPNKIVSKLMVFIYLASITSRESLKETAPSLQLK